ncbi:ABC transporter substrate-binding protein [Candidatus Rhodobacter oscarellae]|nr:extracellular solute-binding protein [Candidatus Rhodobacter lobularis]
MAALTIGAAALGGVAAPAVAQHEGVTVNILTRPGYVIAGPLVERGKDFEALTGAKIVVTEVPFAEIFPKIQNDWATGTNSIDVGVFAAGWGVELDAAGLLEDLDPYVAADDKIDLDDIAPYFREFGQKVGGKTKLLMVDGDFQMVYYRTDVLTEAGVEPPVTWEDYLDVAGKIHGMDMNGDGEADYGSCIFKKRNAQSYFAIQTFAAPIVQTNGTAQGFHFDNATMKPLINNAGWKKAFELYKATGEFGPPEELNMDIGDTRALFKAGRCGLLVEWGDPGTLQLDDDASSIKGKLFAIAAIGSREVLDRETGALVPATAESAPHSIDGVNYSPFAAFGGWAGAINKKADAATKAAAYDFLSYMNQPAQSGVDVTIGATGYNPYRVSQLASTDKWVEAGMPQALADNYLGAINGALANPNMSSDMKIPGAQQYTAVVLDTQLARYLAGEITVEEALENIEEGWEEITEDFGRDEQVEAQALALGSE